MPVTHVPLHARILCPRTATHVECTSSHTKDVLHSPRLSFARTFLLILFAVVTAACSDAVSPSSTDTTTTTTTTTQAAPTVTEVSPTVGSADGGTSVAITGTGFTNVSSVIFGGTAATSFTVNSDTTITAVAPASATGIVDIVVTTIGGSNAIGDTDWFEFAANALTDLSFASASTSAGQPMRGSVSVTFPAPAGGIRIPLAWSLSSNGAGAALYPSTASIAAGATSGSFQVTTFFVSSAVSVTASADHGGQSKAAGFVIGP